MNQSEAIQVLRQWLFDNNAVTIFLSRSGRIEVLCNDRPGGNEILFKMDFPEEFIPVTIDWNRVDGEGRYV